MSLNKAIEHGKEFRKPYRKSQRFDRTCRPGRSFVNKCPYCESNRFIGDARLREKAEDMIREFVDATEDSV